MSAWRDHVVGWLDGVFSRHDEGYLAEKLARAVEDATPMLDMTQEALRDYRAVHPRLDA